MTFCRGSLRALLCFAVWVGVGNAQMAAVTTPEQAFGFVPGTDRKLADWKELTAYHRQVASQSDRVRYEELGKTMEGGRL